MKTLENGMSAPFFVHLYVGISRRLSNGPMESFNKKPSSFRTQSHGLSNFEFSRNRILWSERKDAHILGVPKTKKEIHVKTGKKRGTYNKQI